MMTMVFQLLNFCLFIEEQHVVAAKYGGLFWVAFLVWALGHVLDASLSVAVRLGKVVGGDLC